MLSRLDLVYTSRKKDPVIKETLGVSSSRLLFFSFFPPQDWENEKQSVSDAFTRELRSLCKNSVQAAYNVTTASNLLKVIFVP